MNKDELLTLKAARQVIDYYTELKSPVQFEDMHVVLKSLDLLLKKELAEVE